MTKGSKEGLIVRAGRFALRHPNPISARAITALMAIFLACLGLHPSLHKQFDVWLGGAFLLAGGGFIVWFYGLAFAAARASYVPEKVKKEN